MVFYVDAASGPRKVFMADVRKGAVVATHVVGPREDASLSALDLQMVAALKVARDAGKTPCRGSRFNVVALPPASPNAPIVVYLLTPMLRPGEYPMGGHFEVDVGLDGQVIASHTVAASCQIVTPTGGVGGGVAPAYMHRPDPTPTEIHVYLSLWMGEPLYVTTINPAGNRIWSVDGKTITLVRVL